jgi:hypothetical protein
VALRVEPFNVATYDVHIQAVARLRLKLIFDCVLRNPTVIRYANVFYTVRIESLQRLWLTNAKTRASNTVRTINTPPIRGFYYKWRVLDFD